MDKSHYFAQPWMKRVSAKEKHTRDHREQKKLSSYVGYTCHNTHQRVDTYTHE